MQVNNLNYFDSHKLLPKIFSDEIIGLNRTDVD